MLLSWYGLGTMGEPVEFFTWRMDGRGRLWVETPLPGFAGWLAAALLVPDGARLVVMEVRVIPDAGRYVSAKGAKSSTFTLGAIEWTFGPGKIAKGGGEWSRNLKDLKPDQKKGITAKMLRAVPFATIRGEVQARAAANLPRAWKVALHAGLRDDAHYAEWARRYVEHGGSLKKLSSRYRTTYTTVVNHVRGARERGLLTSEGQGRGGGVLTPEAYRILAAAERGDKT